MKSKNAIRYTKTITIYGFWEGYEFWEGLDYKGLLRADVVFIV